MILKSAKLLSGNSYFQILMYPLLQYLKYRGLEKSVSAFESECFENGTPICSTEVTPKASQKQATVQVCLMSLVMIPALEVLNVFLLLKMQVATKSGT